jgi:putative PIN family toxin of toxin-antitoxin system
MPDQAQLKVVLDTNVLVSGLISSQGPPRQIVDAWLEGRFTLVTSLYLVEEVAHVLTHPGIAERVRLGEPEVDAVLAALLSQAEMAPGELELPGVTRDPKDDAVVACAVEGEADYIVSGDGDLLVLGEYAGIEVVTPRRFVEIAEED